MKPPISRALGCLCLAVITGMLMGCRAGGERSRPETNSAARVVTSLDAQWQFLQGDATGAEQPEFNAGAWRTVDVPHDWSIAGPFSQTNRTGGAGGFLPAGVGWYRKEFTMAAADSQRRVFVEFDGVMANSDVWINGFHLGRRPYGYVSFRYELTGHLRPAGRPNTIAVRADNSPEPASRWYAGAGIYRHVRLVVTEAVHFEQWGNFVTTSVAPGTSPATVSSRSTVTNQSDVASSVTVSLTLLDARGTVVAAAETPPQAVPPHQSAVFQPAVQVARPQLWNLENPYLYRAVLAIHSGRAVVDDETVPVGIRHFEFKADTGFWLNGKNFQIYGVCLHQDASAFGVAVPLSAWERRLKALRELGVNAIRTAHNPMAPEFLDLCDRMGFLVMDEFFDCWTVGKNSFDYHLYFNDWSKIDARDTIRRDRNHPSIVLYSIGNEIHDTPKEELAKGIARGLVDVCHENDPTRPVTQALFRPNVSHDYDNGLADMLDVIGTNYRDPELLAAQRAKPSRKIIGTEQRHERATWLNLRDNPSHSGQFLWSGIDYLGESRGWPIVAAGSGLLDRTAMARPLGYERQSWWLPRPMVFITRRAGATANTPTDPGFDPLDRRQVLFPDWTPRTTAAHEETVEIYSNCKEVELFLNGKSLGTKTLPADASPRNWRMPFEAGTIKAIGRNDGKEVAAHELRTAGKPAKILLSADRESLAPAWDDASCVTATVVDEHGVPVPTAGGLITFQISGPGVIAAVDNANNSSHEPFQASERLAYQGRCFAWIKASAAAGTITLTASGAELGTASITLKTTAK